MKNYYVVYEKTYIERLGELIEDETNIGQSLTVQGLIEYLRKRDIKVAKSAIYKAINTRQPIYDKYFFYKIRM